MKRIISSLILGIILLIIPGCQRYVGLIKCSFFGGDVVYTNTSAACPYMCSLVVYDQFQTAGFFDVLWLSAPVRCLYVDLFATRNCLPEDEIQRMKRDELRQMENEISFYLLMTARDYDTLSTETDNIPPWSATLVVDGKCYSIESVEKLYELAPEYKFIFRERFNKYRQPYKVTFNARKADGSKVIDGCTGCVEFVLSSLCYRTSCVWKRKGDCWSCG